MRTGDPATRCRRRGRPVIADSRLGILLANAHKLERDFRLEGTERQSANTTWEQPWGERSFVRNRINELRVRFVEKRAGAARLDVVFRVTTMASAFAMSSPTGRRFTGVEIAEELTEFAVAERRGRRGGFRSGEWNRYEYLYEQDGTRPRSAKRTRR